MTLMPVSKTSTFVDWSMKAGGALWMGENLVAPTGPASSTGSPTTLRMRPSVSLPTGIMMGLPVSLTSVPRVSPSVESMAMARTVDSPRCWATSRTRLSARAEMLGLVSVSAFRILGSIPGGKSTSTTGPMT